MRYLKESAILGGEEIVIETGRMAKQASGSVLVQQGETMVLVTAVGGSERADASFLPLTCDYVEKTYAAGFIPGSYFRREGRQAEHEILASRLIDRPLRPLFPEGYRSETQVVATVLSADRQHTSDVLAITGASTALMISDIPWNGPIAGVRVGRVDGRFVANPTTAERATSDIDLVMACSFDNIVMVEGEARGISESDMLDALEFGQSSVRRLLEIQLRLQEAVGIPKRPYQPPTVDTELLEQVQNLTGNAIQDSLEVHDKAARSSRFKEIEAQLLERLSPLFPDREPEIARAFEMVRKITMRATIVATRKRVGGRGPTDIRPITAEVTVLPRTHGSALFTRGETQALVTTTVGTGKSDQRFETLLGDQSRSFMLHYNFPPFSVGEVKMLRGPGRREIGHGILAHRALELVLPSQDVFPYTIRVVSEILESNGSSSMATVCGGSLALMDAGVPVSEAVAGIAMGLIKEGDRFLVLSDILGEEDAYGDMDFKVAGTRRGITAFQMDTKISGISREVMETALEQARVGRLFILDKMDQTISKPRPELSPHAPRIITIQIKTDRIRDLIGPGGKHIRGIIEATGCDINVEDDGTVEIASIDSDAAQRALEMVHGLTMEAEVGAIYLGVVSKVIDPGAFITILPNLDGFCHISELTEDRVERVTDVLQEGDEVLVKCISIDRAGKVKLSRREALGQQPTHFGLRKSS
ncbi:MAG: polyribonucleotide nucleotidyltransferase [Bradymonadales bacterium]|nr:polyribonucleotide nucleotidyltransferase [Bradymonadales bacterium]